MAKIFLILCIVVGLVQTAEALEISFNPSGSVDDSVIKLGDIVSFDENTEMTKALATVIVGQAPSPGEKSSLSSLSIKEHLLSTQSLPQDTRWIGSPTVTIIRRGVTVGPAIIQTIIAQYIDNNKANLPEAEIRFIPSSLPLPFTLPTGELTHEVIPSNPGILNSSRISIIFRVDDKVVKNMSVLGKIEALAPVIVSTGSLKRGDILQPQNLTKVVMDIDSINDPGFNLQSFVGKKLNRSLRAGAPVLLSMVESLPIIQRGERVKIVINSGALHLTATGLARSDGSLDQMIRVQNINSNKIIYCRVSAPGLVEVIL